MRASATANHSLEDLRFEIEQIDDSIHELLVQRASVSQRIGRVKPFSECPWRPARELVVFSRLLRRHYGTCSKDALLYIWQEIMAGSLLLQGASRLSVYCPTSSRIHVESVYRNFGRSFSASYYECAHMAIDVVVRGESTLAVLPLSAQRSDQEKWLDVLIKARVAGLQVLARVPLIRLPQDEIKHEALVLGRGEPDRCGIQRTLLLIESSQELYLIRGVLLEALRGIGLKAKIFNLTEKRSGETWVLVECRGYLVRGSSRLEEISQVLKIESSRLHILGVYPAPVEVVDLIPEEI